MKKSDLIGLVLYAVLGLIAYNIYSSFSSELNETRAELSHVRAELWDCRYGGGAKKEFIDCMNLCNK